MKDTIFRAYDDLRLVMTFRGRDRFFEYCACWFCVMNHLLRSSPISLNAHVEALMLNCSVSPAGSTFQLTPEAVAFARAHRAARSGCAGLTGVYCPPVPARYCIRPRQSGSRRRLAGHYSPMSVDRDDSVGGPHSSERGPRADGARPDVGGPHSSERGPRADAERLGPG